MNLHNFQYITTLPPRARCLPWDVDDRAMRMTVDAFTASLNTAKRKSKNIKILTNGGKIIQKMAKREDEQNPFETTLESQYRSITH